MRSYLRQGTSLGLALLFGASLGANAFGWHGCPHHGHGGGSGTDDPEDVVSAPSGEPGLVPGEDGHDQDSGPGTCICLGTCHAGAATALSPATGLALADEAVRRPATFRPPRGTRHRRPAYFLPFPHGPPGLG